MKKWKFLTAAAALTLMLAACGDDEAKDTSAEDTGAETTQTEDKEATENSAFPMKVSSLTGGSETEEGKQVTFEDVVTGGNKTITMYTSDRTIKPLFVDKGTHKVTQDEVLAFNLIDCGLE